MAKKFKSVKNQPLPIEKGISILRGNKIFDEMLSNYYLDLRIVEYNFLDKNSAAIVQSDGKIFLNKNFKLSEREWAYVIAHCILHLSFNHFDFAKIPEPCDKKIWNMACDIFVAKFLSDIKIGKPPFDSIEIFNGNKADEVGIYNYLLANKNNLPKYHFGTAAIFQEDMKFVTSYRDRNYFSDAFALALAHSVQKTIQTASNENIAEITNSKKAADWFINHFPLLGGLASCFKIIENINFCRQNEIKIAAVDVTKAEIYVNPTAGLNFEELKFVLAHEFLHAGLNHHERRQGRNAFIWNIACDFVINLWLYEMNVGKMPQNILFDEDLKNMSAEEIYDKIISDLRKYSKLQTLRGWGKGDIIDDEAKNFKNNSQTSLDDFYKSALQNGLGYHLETKRGLIPAGLIEEIRALAMPPINWNVELGKWFEIYFPSLEPKRTYARPSRRQGSTPDIPRPRYISAEMKNFSRTFGVVIDTSGSMTAKMIGYALGAVASYSAAKNVPYARVIFCDATAYDAGYLSPEEIAGKVEIKGRGGTILQPAVDFLLKAKDFPKDAPILIITDGWIEKNLVVKRDHAFLIPRGRHLPFFTRSKIFYFSE